MQSYFTKGKPNPTRVQAYTEETPMAVKDRIAALDGKLVAWEEAKASLRRQAAALDITENEEAVFLKRERTRLQKELVDGVRLLAAEARSVLASSRGKAADSYRTTYWKDNAPDM
ncbi:MAG: hypothetical protein Q8R28_04235, partial [Dehalococcoidia bacterium]|nr:hypothetical protein [Dehalococcoidia bacterium]